MFAVRQIGQLVDAKAQTTASHPRHEGIMPKAKSYFKTLVYLRQLSHPAGGKRLLGPFGHCSRSGSGHTHTNIVNSEKKEKHNEVRVHRVTGTMRSRIGAVFELGAESRIGVVFGSLRDRAYLASLFVEIISKLSNR